MKKRLSLLLILCLLAMGAPALAAPGDAILLQSGEDGFTVASSFALIGDTLYALSSASLFTVPAAGGDSMEYAIDTAALATQENGRFIPANVIAAGDTPLVYGYECLGGEEDYCNFALYRVELAEGVARLTPQIALPAENMVEYMGIFAMPRQLYAPFVLDGKMVARSHDAGSSIAVVDLASGELTLIEGLLPLFQWLIPYQDGAALAIAYDDLAGTAAIHKVDLGQATAEPLCEFAVAGAPGHFCYDESAGALFFAMDGELYKMEGMQPESLLPVAALPLTGEMNALPVLTQDGFLIAGDSMTILRRNTDPSQRADALLNIQQNYHAVVESAFKSFAEAHPEIELNLVESHEDIIQAMLTQSSTMDVFALCTADAAYSALFERGYMAELTDSAAIAQMVQAMYPAIQNAVCKEGEVYALPVEMHTGRGLISYNAELWASLGYAPEEFPQTWPAFLRLLAQLGSAVEAGKMDALAPYYSIDGFREELFRAMLDAYMLYISQPGREFHLDTPLFREMAEAFEAIDFAALGFPETVDLESAAAPENVLIELFTNFTAGINSSSAYRIAPLAMQEGETPLIAVQLYAVFVNPYSANRDLAIAFLEEVAAQQDPLFLAHTTPGKNDAVPNEHYAESLAVYDAEIASLEERLDSAEDEAQKAALQAEIELSEQYRAEFEANNRYLADEASIAAYRELAEFLAVTPFWGLDEETSIEYDTAIREYLSGLIDIDEFIARIDQKLKMIVLEGQ